MDLLSENRLLTTEEVGKYLGVQARTVRNWINQEELKGVKVRNLWRVRPEDLRAFLQKPEEERSKRMCVSNAPPRRGVIRAPGLPASLLSETNLSAGVQWWRTRPTWECDFHNRFYADLQCLRQNGLNEEWWQAIVDHLWKWRALRPLGKAVVKKRGQFLLPRIEQEYNRVIAAGGGAPDLGNVQWDMLEPLYRLAAEIKPVKGGSPVFPSKLLHFLLPAACPVYDNEAVGGFDTYADYWHFCQEAWQSAPPATRAVLTNTLRGHIGGGVVLDYPFPTKVVELCVIGARARGENI